MANPKRKTTAWVFSTYFAEGMPLSLLRFFAGVYLTDIGLPESVLGKVNFWLALPWNLKFLWAPAVDLTATRRQWLLRTELLLGLLTFGLLGLVFVGPMVLPDTHWLPWVPATSLPQVADLPAVRGFVALLVAMAALAATHDIAIDGFYMEAIPDQATAASYTGMRNVAYRLAVVFVKTGLVWLAGMAGWTWGFAGAAVTLLGLVALHAWILPHPVRTDTQRHSMASATRNFSTAFGSFLKQPRIVLVLVFLVTWKLGDEILFSMSTPFLKRELHVSNQDLAWVAGMAGTWAAIAGSLVSAWAISRYGLRRAVWPLALGMNLNILVYVWLAWLHPDGATASGLWTIAAVHAYEQFAAGLGNAVLVVYIMRLADKRFQAAHYAIGSAIAPLGGTLFNLVAGDIVESSGYVTLYVLAFLLSLPSMACLFVLPMPEPRPAD